MKRVAGALAGAIGLLVLGAGTASAQPCLPPAVQKLVSAPRATAPAPITLYLDRSMSMAGYAAGATHTVRPLGDLLAVLDQQAALSGSPMSAFAFGATIAGLKGAADTGRFAKPAAYLCKGCDNLESRIDSVLQAVQKSGKGRLNIIVTDLWLDNKATAAAPQVALGLPLKAMIAEGRAIAVVGVRSPFAGTIYDVPGVGKVTSAKERAWFTILVGPEADVQRTIAALHASGSAAFGPDRMKFSVFTAGQRVNRLPPPRASGGGVRGLRALKAAVEAGMPAFSFAPRLAARQNGRVVERYSAAAGQPAGLVWSGPMATDTTVWRLNDAASKKCDPSAAWTPFPDLSGAWRPNGSSTATFSFNSATSARLPAGDTYLVAGWIGTQALQRPNPGTAWMRDWSVTETSAPAFARARPSFFKALNLAELARLMEDAVAAANSNGRLTGGFAFIVRIED